MTIMIEGALDVEVEYFIKEYDCSNVKIINGYEYYCGSYEDNNIVISKTGVGTINGALSTAFGVTEFKPDLVINQGIAGGYLENIHTGDIVIGEYCRNINSFKTPQTESGKGSNPFAWVPDKRGLAIHNADKRLIESLYGWASGHVNKNIFRGTIGSGDIFSKEQDRIKWLQNEFGAMCEDMESIGTYSACEHMNIPVLGVRIISNNELIGEGLDKSQSVALQKLLAEWLKELMENRIEPNINRGNDISKDVQEYEQYAFAGVRKKNEKISEYVRKGITTACLFFSRRLDEYMEKLGGIIVGRLTSATDTHNIYLYKNSFYIRPMLGSANAAGWMEELIACGIRKFIAAGPAGKLSKDYNCEFLIPDSVINESGFYGAYGPECERTSPCEDLSEKIAGLLTNEGFQVDRGTVWTTQAYYRETPEAVKNKLEQGAVAVDMECGSWCQVASFRNVDFAEVLYFSDSVDKDSYGRYTDRKEKNDFLMRLMIDLVTRI
ncbi:MAG: 5'-methylthioadenosine/S-adenosylhomocysteine nucleosidase [Catonella sp.]|nr:5'-methylthioadenosine/S-adenosylhomocysteine nucleosidase [Catonella sp.]MDY6357262.1 5'-methylthioadenosine/S-adenosylhomocysteine nucleosidase [Catonella sp.]